MDTTTLENITHHVGIDISKEKLDCWLRPAAKHLQVNNGSKGFGRLFEWLKAEDCRPENTIVCMEDTGLYGKRLLVALTETGWPAAVEKTTIIENVSPDHHRKDDEFDASMIAEYADRFGDRLHLTEAPKEALERMSQLYSERRRLVRQRAATKTKCTQAGAQPHCPQLLREGWEKQLEMFNGQIGALEDQMAAIVEAHGGLECYFELLTSIPGVGQVNAWFWLITFYGEATLNPKNIASRFGVAPHSYSSGSSVRGRTRSSGHGAAEMRANMTLAARSASTHSKRYKYYKKRKLEEGKCWPVVRNNLVNKLITTICAIWNSGELYDPDHTSRFDREKKAA